MHLDQGLAVSYQSEIGIARFQNMRLPEINRIDADGLGRADGKRQG